MRVRAPGALDVLRILHLIRTSWRAPTVQRCARGRSLVHVLALVIEAMAPDRELPAESPRLDDPRVDAESLGDLVQAHHARFAQPCPAILQTIGTPDGGDPVSAKRLARARDEPPRIEDG